jgi:hypothetical protein
MSAPIGNRFWEARSTHGRKPIYSSPDDLMDACIQYFEWNEDNPLFDVKVTQYQGEAVDLPVAKMRAMTIASMCLYIGMSVDAWSDYRHREGFSGVTKEAEQIIYAQKFAGAAADMLNANIIARDLALVEKTETKLALGDLSDDELKRMLAQLEQG